MLPLRSAVLRRPFAQQFPRPSRAVLRTTERQSWQRVAGRRGYADAHGGSHQAGSDLPWAVGAVVVTIPSVWYLLQPSESSHGDHDSHDGGHEEKQEEGGEEGAPAEDSEEKSEDKGEEKPDEGEESEEKPEEKSDDAQKDDKNKGEEKPKDDEKKEDKPEDNEENEDPAAEADKSQKPSEGKAVVEKQDTGKAGGKKKIPSPRSQPLGAAGDPEGIEKRATNQPAKHSSDILENPEKSKKKEGAPDTAKLPGRVDPSR